jgi:hypothetical protein
VSYYLHGVETNAVTPIFLLCWITYFPMLDMWWRRSEEPTPLPLCGRGVRTNNYTLYLLCTMRYLSLYISFVQMRYLSLYISFVQCVIYRSIFPLYNALCIDRVGSDDIHPAPARIHSDDIHSARINSADDPLRRINSADDPLSGSEYI